MSDQGAGDSLVVGNKHNKQTNMNMNLSENFPYQWFLKCVPRPAAAAASGHLLEMLILGPTKSETLAMGPRHLYFNKASLAILLYTLV